MTSFEEIRVVLNVESLSNGWGDGKWEIMPRNQRYQHPRSTFYAVSSNLHNHPLLQIYMIHVEQSVPSWSNTQKKER